MAELTNADVSGVLQRANQLSEHQLKTMREIAEEIFGQDTNIIIGVNGSVARRETTSGSDVDLFFLGLDEAELTSLQSKQDIYRARLRDAEIKMPAHGGVFDEPLLANELCETIGGDDDTNLFITRRMLFLLEGEWIYNQAAFEALRSGLICRYVAEDLSDEKIALFLLNDIIRYWRTICVDFEHKTQDVHKPRAIRNIKLRFSRMLLYFAGVAAVSKTGGMSGVEKRAKLETLFSMPALARIQDVFEDKAGPLTALYAEFLASIDNPEIRSVLERSGDEGIATKEYDVLVPKAREFKDALLTILFEDLKPNHEVVRALLL
ncbi:MAG: hypothetical protein ABJG96_14705 [Paracoccaceae bacterium]